MNIREPESLTLCIPHNTMVKFFVFLLLTLFASSAYADVFESIDCGSSGIYTDENLIVWTGDGTLIQNGQTEVVVSDKVSTVMSTLRVFTSRKKNCYSIDAEKGGQVLVRASFFYGNYDKKSAPPTFDLHFDGNFWATVETELDQLVYYEVAYVVKGDQISVCLAQTKPGQYPFISALEVRSLGSHMYGGVGSNYALYLESRVAYGANSTIRYSDDPYDRIWVPARAGNGLTVLTSDAIFIDTSTSGDNPPGVVMQNAITPITGHAIILTPTFPTEETPIYVTMYFSEVQQLDTTQNRSFQIYKDNNPISPPISPPYGSVSEMYVSNITATSNTTFSLVATSDSTLPPLINAAEIFYVSDPLTDGTDSKDVQGLGELKNAFDNLQEWVGDPCLPFPYTWDWLNCSTDATPRVTSLYLNGFNLAGPLPDFSSMDALEIVDLHNNSLNGPIPDFLGTLPNLRELNLGDNSFSGPIPTTVSNNKKIKLVVSGNPDLCLSAKSCTTSTTQSGSSSDVTPSGSIKTNKSKLPVILGSVIPVFVVFWAVVGFIVLRHHKRKTAAVFAATTANGGGVNGTEQAQGAQANNNMFGKIGEAVMHEIKVNIQDQITNEIGNQNNSQNQQTTQ